VRVIPGGTANFAGMGPQHRTNELGGYGTTQRVTGVHGHGLTVVFAEFAEPENHVKQ
jgi:hypothetical protein